MNAVKECKMSASTFLMNEADLVRIVRSYPVLRYMFWVYLEPDWSCFFSNMKIKIPTSLNKLVISSSKLYLHLIK